MAAAVAAATGGCSQVAVARPDVPVVAVIGILIVAADATYATATTLGLISIAAAVGALYPLVTIGLARIRLHELLSRPQEIASPSPWPASQRSAWRKPIAHADQRRIATPAA